MFCGRVGMRMFRTRRSASRKIAASPTLNTTMVKGGSSCTAIPVKKNEPPQSTDSASSIDHSRQVMVRLIVECGSGRCVFTGGSLGRACFGLCVERSPEISGYATSFGAAIRFLRSNRIGPV